MKNVLINSIRYSAFGLLMLFAGILIERNQLLLSHIVDEMLQVRFLLLDDPWYIRSSPHSAPVIIQKPEKMADGLTKLVHFTANNAMTVSVIESDGTSVQQWPIDWFSLWPDAEHIPYSRRPKSRPGTMVHGAEIMPDGDLIFNFEYLGMVRLDACGNVRWRLQELTHHSVHMDNNGFIWTSINSFHHFPQQPFALHRPYYTEPFIAKISPQGNVVLKKSLLDILAENHYYGALYLSSLNNTLPVVKGDTLHVNDVETYPAQLPQGFFNTGDIMVSLRNINTILIIEPDSWRIKHAISHVMLRQHDPVFIDGNTIAVFDNNTRFEQNDPAAYSRIIRISVPDNSVTTVFKGSAEQPFYSATLGKQQWLDNGNILFSDSENGIVYEITASGETVWHYANLIEIHKTAAVQEAKRLPASMDSAFFAAARAQCIR